jgi:VCBS repeat-containing protein
VQYDAGALARDGWTTSDGFTFIKQVQYGTLILDPPPNDPSAGHLAFILDEANPVVRALRVGHQITTDPITIPVIDAEGNTAQTTVTFTIDGTNHPVAQTGVVEAKEDAPSITGQAQASEFGFALTYALVGPNGEAEHTLKTVHGTVTMHSDGSYVYTPDHGFFGSDSFAFQATDGELTTAATTVTVTVDPVAPIAQDDTASA